MDRRRENEIVVYVGTRKLVALAGVVAAGEPRITGYAVRLNPEGFKNGLVTNLEQASSTLEALVGSLFPSLSSDPPSSNSDTAVYVVLGNPKLKTYTFASAQYFQGFQRILSPHDVCSVVDQTRSVAPLPLSEFILQAIPASFLVNDLEDVSNPLGLEAQRLGVRLKIFTIDFQDFKNLSKAFETAELEVKGYFPKTLTASEAVLHESEKSEGALLIDIASEVSFLTLWKKGELINSQVFPVGGRHLSSQLANLWEIDLQDGEKAKEQYGSLEKSPPFGEELIPMVERNGKKSQPVNRQDFQEKFLSLAKEWMRQILSAAEAFSREEKIFHPHYVFTGGGTCLDGFLEFLQQEFKWEGRIGHTRRVDAPNELLVNPSLTSALGIYSWLAYGEGEKSRLLEPKGIFQKTFSVARGWLSNYF